MENCPLRENVTGQEQAGLSLSGQSHLLIVSLTLTEDMWVCSYVTKWCQITLNQNLPWTHSHTHAHAHTHTHKHSLSLSSMSLFLSLSPTVHESLNVLNREPYINISQNISTQKLKGQLYVSRIWFMYWQHRTIWYAEDWFRHCIPSLQNNLFIMTTTRMGQKIFFRSY